MSLKGSLQTVALPEVLDFLSGTAKTGELRVDGAGTEGLLWFEEGSIAGVRVQRGPNPVEAVFQLLRIDDGEFSFNAGESRPDDVAAVDRSDGHVAGVLEQAQDRLRQWAEIVSVVPSLDHRVTLAAAAPGDTVSLERSQWELVVAIGEGRSVGEVIAARDLGEFEGCRAVKTLIEASLVEIGDPVVAEEEPPAPVQDSSVVVEEPAVAAEEPAGVAAEDPTAVAAEEPAVEDETPAFPAEEPAVVSSFGVFSGFGSDGFGSDGFDAARDVSEEPTTAASQDPAVETEVHEIPAEDGADEVHPEAGSDIGPDDVDGEASPVAETGSGEVIDRYASLRSVMAEVGQSLEDDPYLSAATDDEAAMPAFGSPLPYSVLGAGDGPDQPEAYGAEAQPTDGHAALQALLAEVSSEEFAPETEEAVDGLADRGPWTRHELASFDGWRDEEVHAEAVPAPVGETPAAAPDFGQALAHNFAVAEVPAGVAEASEAPVAEPEVEEEPAPAEEPINRGLLLKFLSSVRN